MCTGSQMWHLFNMIPLLLCEFSLDDSELYECFLLLQEITTIVFSLLLCIEQIEYLEFLIPQYLEKFKEILQPRLLTPKCHYLIHLPRLMKR